MQLDMLPAALLLALVAGCLGWDVLRWVVRR